MTNEKLVKILQDCKAGKITVTPKMLSELRKTGDDPTVFKIIMSGDEMIDLYHKACQKNKQEELEIFVDHQYKHMTKGDITRKKLVSYGRIIVSKNTQPEQELARVLCESSFREDQEAFEIIISQKTVEQQWQMYRACTIEAIFKDKKLLRMIAKQSTAKRQEQMIDACEIPKIRANAEALEIIGKQDTEEKQAQMIRACRIDAIREEKRLLEIIGSQDTAERQECMTEACSIKEIREDLEALKMIGEQKTLEQQYTMTKACKISEIRENKKLLRLIAVQDSDEKQDIMTQLCTMKALRTMGESNIQAGSTSASLKHTPLDIMASHLKNTESVDGATNAILATLLDIGLVEEYQSLYRELPIAVRKGLYRSECEPISPNSELYSIVQYVKKKKKKQ